MLPHPRAAAHPWSASGCGRDRLCPARTSRRLPHAAPASPFVTSDPSPGLSVRGILPSGGAAVGANVGDRIVVESERVGTPSREGEILEVIETANGAHYRVRWEDGHETGFWPSAGSARIVAAAATTPGVTPVAPGVEGRPTAASR
jgi:Domain of unknown function (DUF1918)